MTYLLHDINAETKCVIVSAPLSNPLYPLFYDCGSETMKLIGGGDTQEWQVERGVGSSNPSSHGRGSALVSRTSPYGGGGAHPDLATHDALGLAIDSELTTHEAAANPHPTYETSAEAQAKVDAHAGAVDPHTEYVREASVEWIDLTDGGQSTLHAHAGGGGAPTDADYLVGTAHAGLSAEIVVGTAPGGELGGTWGSPTVDATHSGSTHSAATDTHIADATDAHDASAVSVVPAGGIAASDVQAALEELDTEKSATAHTHTHAATTGQTANDHHAQAHVLATGTGLGTDHSISGAAVGEVLRASSATAAAFDQLAHGDLSGITADQHHAQSHTHASHTGIGADDHHAQLHAAAHANGAGDPVKLDDLATPDDNTDLNASTTRHGLLLKLPGGTSTFLRADGTFAAPPGGGGVSIVVKELTADQTISSTTMAKVTGLDQNVDVGTWWFEYRVIWQTTATATAIKLGVNFAGTQTRFVVEATGAEGTTAASTGAMDQVHAAFGLRSGGANRAPSTTTSIFGPTGADTASADMLAIVKGVIVVTVAGNIELYFGSEATGSTQTIESGSALRLTKVSA